MKPKPTAAWGRKDLAARAMESLHVHGNAALCVTVAPLLIQPCYRWAAVIGVVMHKAASPRKGSIS